MDLTINSLETMKEDINYSKLILLNIPTIVTLLMAMQYLMAGVAPKTEKFILFIPVVIVIVPFALWDTCKQPLENIHKGILILINIAAIICALIPLSFLALMALWGSIFSWGN